MAPRFNVPSIVHDKVFHVEADCFGETISTALTVIQEAKQMEFDQWINAHVNWKSKLKAYVAKPDHSLSPAEVAQDNRCDLGKWIAAEGSKHASLPEFQTLRAEHTRFHKAAADVIRHADSGQNVNEEIALGGSSDFSKASAAVVSAIMAIKTKLKPVMANR